MQCSVCVAALCNVACVLLPELCTDGLVDWLMQMKAVSEEKER